MKAIEASLTTCIIVSSTNHVRVRLTLCLRSGNERCTNGNTPPCGSSFHMCLVTNYAAFGSTNVSVHGTRWGRLSQLHVSFALDDHFHISASELHGNGR